MTALDPDLPMPLAILVGALDQVADEGPALAVMGADGETVIVQDFEGLDPLVVITTTLDATGKGLLGIGLATTGTCSHLGPEAAAARPTLSPTPIDVAVTAIATRECWLTRMSTPDGNSFTVSEAIGGPIGDLMAAAITPTEG